MTGTAPVLSFEEATAKHRAGDLHAALHAYARLLCEHVSEGLLPHLLGVVLHQLGHARDAQRWLVRAAAILGPEPTLQHNLGEAAWVAGDARTALTAYGRALARQPDLIDSRISLSMVLREVGAAAASDREARVSLALAPGHPRAHLAFGLARESAAGFVRAACIDPSSSGAWTNLGAMRLRDAALGAAGRACRRALALTPATGEAWVNYGSVQLGFGWSAAAVRLQRRGLALRPTPELHSNILFAMLSDPASSDFDQLAEAKRWERNYALPLAVEAFGRRAGDDPERRLVIGYVSGDFRKHPVAGNVVELIDRHDRTRFDVYCYGELARSDAVTERFKMRADRWVETNGRSDADVARQIRDDRVDVLVFLGGHTAANRLLLAARRPAPVQVSFHAPSTTGLDSIDHWLTDAHLTPPGWEARFAEAPYRLPVFYTFQEPAPTAVAPPGGDRHQPVFGSFNNPGKINDDVLTAWARILVRVPGARLRLGYHRYFEDAALRGRVLAAMGEVGDRIDFLPSVPDGAGHFARLGDVDMILDTFPFGGATSSFESLWMGVPVLTLDGERFVGRVGGALNRLLGLDDFVASDGEDYVERAVRRISERARLRALRSELRDRLRRSPVMDHAGQTRALEDAYRAMWRRWCLARRDA